MNIENILIFGIAIASCFLFEGMLEGYLWFALWACSVQLVLLIGKRIRRTIRRYRRRSYRKYDLRKARR